MKYSKVLILNFPKIALDAPPLAPALLSSICHKHGIEHDFVDCNLEFHQQLSNSVLKEEILELYSEMIVDKLSPDGQLWVDHYFLNLANLCENYDLIAISIFSVHSVNLVRDFLKKHRHQIHADIVIGGAGIRSDYQNEPFYQYLYQEKLIDHWILGEGEVGFTELLLDKSDSVSINNTVANYLENFDWVPAPSFDKFRISDYRMGTKNLISVEGSRGCVRRCTFCDIHHTWGAFKYKDGTALAKELIELKQKYKFDHFWFNDSLINGSLRAFRAFISNLAKSRVNNDFTWSSQAIIRPKTSKDEEDFKLMKASGCETLAVGLESFSEPVRWHMGKKFTDDDVDNFLHLAQKYNISIYLLMIIGYPTETEKDFNHALTQLEKYQHLADDGTIVGIRIGRTMQIYPSIPIYDQMQQNNIKLIDSTQHKTVTWVRGENTLKKRIEWRVRFEDHATKLGYYCFDTEMSVEKTFLNYLAGTDR